MSLRQAAQQALEALEWNYNTDLDNIPACEQWAKMLKETMATLRAALAEPNRAEKMRAAGYTRRPTLRELAEPEQEPVAWIWKDGTVTADPDRADGTWTPLYTAPTPRRPLTDEEIEMAYRHIWRDLPSDFDHTTASWIEQGIRYAEAAHGIKEQEP